MSDDAPAERPIGTRGEFRSAVHEAIAEAAHVGCRELWLCDEDFADWPLGERELVERLASWAASNRRMVLIARDFDELARRHGRWVRWRQTWSHIVSCRTPLEVGVGRFPTLLLSRDLGCIRLVDTERCRGIASRDRGDRLRCKEQIDALLQRSEEAFPATTTGL